MNEIGRLFFALKCEVQADQKLLEFVEYIEDKVNKTMFENRLELERYHIATERLLWKNAKEDAKEYFEQGNWCYTDYEMLTYAEGFESAKNILKGGLNRE